MSYRVTQDKAYSDEFKASLGILQEDPCSPTLFILYLSDFVTSDDVNDIILAEIIIAHLQPANNPVLLSWLLVRLDGGLGSGPSA